MTLSKLEFDKKRHKNIITPCCNKKNYDGKFVSFKNHPINTGYCHSCGITTLPKSNTIKNFNKQRNCNTTEIYCNTKKPERLKYVDFEAVSKSLKCNTSNNFISYLYSKYPADRVKKAINMYHIGTSEKKATVFWYVNKKQLIQKSKHIWYNSNGKRTDYFKVPYKNEDGYRFCLFGEHLLKNNSKPIILVESEKSAIICSIEMPDFTWLAYSGINGLTDEKVKSLKNEKIYVIPDLSRKAVNIILKKRKLLKGYNIACEIIDFTYGEDDECLKDKGFYNEDIADFFDKDNKYFDILSYNKQNHKIDKEDQFEWEQIYQLEKRRNERISNKNEEKHRSGTYYVSKSKYKNISY